MVRRGDELLASGFERFLNMCQMQVDFFFPNAQYTGMSVGIQLAFCDQYYHFFAKCRHAGNHLNKEVDDALYL
jgi:hypothetical protein